MKKKQVPWWKNTKNPTFWLVLTPLLMFVAYVIFNILSVTRHAPETVVLQADSGSIGAKTIPSIIDLKSPAQLDSILAQQPIIQAQRTFENFYRGKRVRWTGIVSNAYEYTRPRYFVKKEDSLKNVHDMSSEESPAHIASKEDTVYEIQLAHIRGGLFYASLSTKWRNLVEFLNRGDTLTIEGTLYFPNELIKCTLIRK